MFATNTSGTQFWTLAYSPFGGVTASTGTPANMRFPGQWFQAESGLYQNWMRDYDPTTGRYIQADPLGLVDGASVYGYARQNPGRWTDPRGTDSWDWDGPGSTAICSYYDRMAAANAQCGYYPRAAQICRGEDPLVNLLTTLAIREAWHSGRNKKSQSQIMNELRSHLIFYDYQLRDQGKIGSDGCVCGDDIDFYHLMTFDEVGLNNAFYGGHWWPHSFPPNPVPNN